MIRFDFGKKCVNIVHTQEGNSSIYSLKTLLFNDFNPFQESDQISRSVVSNSLRPHESQPGLPVHHQLPEFTQTHVHQVSDAIHLFHPLSSPSPPAPNPSQHQSLFQMSQLFAWGGQSTRVSALASVLPKKSQGFLLQNGLVGSPCSPRDSQESSPTTQFKSINSLALSLLHSPTLTSIHDHWKNHSLD